MLLFHSLVTSAVLSSSSRRHNPHRFTADGVLPPSNNFLYSPKTVSCVILSPLLKRCRCNAKTNKTYSRELRGAKKRLQRIFSRLHKTTATMTRRLVLCRHKRNVVVTLKPLKHTPENVRGAKKDYRGFSVV